MFDLTQVFDTLQELERMHQLNLEVLEQLNIICEWILKNDIRIPNKEKLDSLFLKTCALLREMYNSSPKTLQYRKLSDEILHDNDSDEDFTEPRKDRFIRNTST